MLLLLLSDAAYSMLHRKPVILPLDFYPPVCVTPGSLTVSPALHRHIQTTLVLGLGPTMHVQHAGVLGLYYSRVSATQRWQM